MKPNPSSVCLPGAYPCIARDGISPAAPA